MADQAPKLSAEQVATSQRARFENERGFAIALPPPPFPALPEVWLRRYPPELQQALRQYSFDCQEWVKKYVISQTS